MKMDKFLKTWEGTLSENRFSRLVIAGLIAAVILVSIKAFSRDTVVTLQPYTLTEDAWVMENQSSQSYKEAWALLLATLTGNVTPGTVGFVRERLEPLLAPSIYREVMEAIEVQALYITKDRVTMRFEPRTVEYEPERDVVYVYGESYLTGSSGESVRDDRTYEYQINISNFAPMITHINTYSGQPRTKSVLERESQREQRERNNG